jgi:hypothetical protein
VVVLKQPATTVTEVEYEVVTSGLPSDYTIDFPSPLIFQPNQQEQLVTIRAVHDAVSDSDQTIDLTLTGVNNGYTVDVERDTTTVRIINYETYVYVETSGVAVAGRAKGMFKVKLTSVNDNGCTVDFSLSGTAVDPSDYTIDTISPVTFNAGEVEKIILVSAPVGTTNDVTLTLTLDAINDPNFILAPTNTDATLRCRQPVDGSMSIPVVIWDKIFDVGVQPWTMEGYFYHTNNGIMFALPDAIHQFYYSATRMAIRAPTLWVASRAASGTSSSFSTGLIVNGWNHIAMSFTGTESRFYFNGIFSSELGGIHSIGSSRFATGDPTFYSSSCYCFVTSMPNVTNLRFTVGESLYNGGNFTPPSLPLAVLPNTVIMCYADNDINPAADASNSNATPTYVSGGSYSTSYPI